MCFDMIREPEDTKRSPLDLSLLVKALPTPTGIVSAFVSIECLV